MVAPKEIVINGVDRTADVIGFANAVSLDRVTSGRHSLLFLTELFCRATMSGDLNPFMVMDEIKYLEGIGTPTRTKMPSMFNRGVLSGLWHKHHLEVGVSSMAANLQNALKNYRIPVLEEMLKEAEASGEDALS